jgi:MFS transporter, UMF1 family
MAAHDAGMTPGPTTDAGPTHDALQRRREQTGWYFYDWANSAFSTTVVTVFLGPLLTSVTEKAAGADDFVHPLGIPVRSGSFFPYVVSLSVLLQVVVLPVTGAIADRSRSKKRMLATLAYVGSVATMGMFFLGGARYLLGGVLFLIANVAFGASIVVYNSFLPEIAEPHERDAVSSRGFGLGYLGGGLLLLANLVLFTARDAVGLSEGDAARICLLSGGAWWALWTLVPMARLRNRPSAHPIDVAGPATVVAAGFRQLASTVRGARAYPQTVLFLAAYLLYNDGIQTVITLSATYGKKELGLEQSTLIQAILMVQFVAFGGALLFDRVARRIGAKRTVVITLIMWVVTTAYSYLLPAGAVLAFFLLAAAIGLILGGSQALSRSLFSQMIPPGRQAEYFSLYEISERGTSWLGPFVFGISLQISDSYRTAIVSLVVFFVAGLLVLVRVDVPRAIRESGNPGPMRLDGEPTG